MQCKAGEHCSGGKSLSFEPGPIQSHRFGLGANKAMLLRKNVLGLPSHLPLLGTPLEEGKLVLDC